MAKKNGNIKPSKPMKRWIRTQVQYLRGQLFLHAWTIDVCYCMPKKHQDKKTGESKGEAIASISTDHKYMQCTLHVHPLFGEEWNKKNRSYHTLMATLVHEFVHIHTNRLYKFAYQMVPDMLTDHLEEIRENETQCIAVAIMNLIPEKQYKK